LWLSLGFLAARVKVQGGWYNIPASCGSAKRDLWRNGAYVPKFAVPAGDGTCDVQGQLNSLALGNDGGIAFNYCDMAAGALPFAGIPPHVGQVQPCAAPPCGSGSAMGNVNNRRGLAGTFYHAGAGVPSCSGGFAVIDGILKDVTLSDGHRNVL
jgi:hypothetical protein